MDTAEDASSRCVCLQGRRYGGISLMNWSFCLEETAEALLPEKEINHAAHPCEQAYGIIERRRDNGTASTHDHAPARL